MMFVQLSGIKGGKYPHDSTMKARTFVVRDFVIGTSTALVATVRIEGTDVKVHCFLMNTFVAIFDVLIAFAAVIVISCTSHFWLSKHLMVIVLQLASMVYAVALCLPCCLSVHHKSELCQNG